MPSESQLMDEQLLAIQNELQAAHKQLKEAMKNEDFPKMNELIQEKVAIYLTSVFNTEVLAILADVEPYYIKHDPSLLPEFYCIKAHTYFFAQNYKIARHYYRLAMSYGLQYEKYGTIAASMTNLLAEKDQSQTISPEKYLMQAESIPIIYSYSSNYNDETQCRRLFHLISAQLDVGDIDKADKCLSFIESKNAFHEPERTWVQLQLYRGRIYEKRNQFKEAMQLYNKVMQVSIAQLDYYDIAEIAYGNLFNIANTVLEDTPLAEEFEKFQWFKQQDELEVEKYALQSEGVYQHPLVQQSIARQDFIEQATVQKENATDYGVSVICVANFEQQVLTNLDTLATFYEAFHEQLSRPLLKNTDGLFFMFNGSADCIQKRCQEIRTAIQSDKLYVSVSNDVEDRWRTVEHGLMLAHARIYYEMNEENER